MKVKGMRIGELAARAGVSASRIRFYEARGLLPPATRLANGYRDYDDHTLSAVSFVVRAQGLGFTLGEVASHLQSPDRRGRKARLQARLEEKLAELDTHLSHVHARRENLVRLIEEVRLTRTG